MNTLERLRLKALVFLTACVLLAGPALVLWPPVKAELRQILSDITGRKIPLIVAELDEILERAVALGIPLEAESVGRGGAEWLDRLRAQNPEIRFITVAAPDGRRLFGSIGTDGVDALVDRAARALAPPEPGSPGADRQRLVMDGLVLHTARIGATTHHAATLVLALDAAEMDRRLDEALARIRLMLVPLLLLLASGAGLVVDRAMTGGLNRLRLALSHCPDRPVESGNTGMATEPERLLRLHATLVQTVRQRLDRSAAHAQELRGQLPGAEAQDRLAVLEAAIADMDRAVVAEPLIPAPARPQELELPLFLCLWGAVAAIGLTWPAGGPGVLLAGAWYLPVLLLAGLALGIGQFTVRPTLARLAVAALFLAALSRTGGTPGAEEVGALGLAIGATLWLGWLRPWSGLLAGAGGGIAGLVTVSALAPLLSGDLTGWVVLVPAALGVLLAAMLLYRGLPAGTPDTGATTTDRGA